VPPCEKQWFSQELNYLRRFPKRQCPLLRSLKAAWPEAAVDVLVFRGKGAMLRGNPDIRQVIEVTESPPLSEWFALARRLFRRYHLALTVQAGDRPMVYAWLAAPRRYGIVSSLRRTEAWKRFMLSGWALLDNVTTHTVVQNLVLAQLLGLKPLYDPVPPSDSASRQRLKNLLGFDFETEAFGVLHPYPRWRYKHWHDAGWLGSARFLHRSALRVVLSGGPAGHEIEGCRALAERLDFPVSDLAGKLDLADLALLYRHARIYLGPDTATTHLAAACGTPTVALYGPSNPMKWAPWPLGYSPGPGERTPYHNRASLQQVGNVWLLQPPDECVPCYEEGCDRKRTAIAWCLERYPEEPVIQAMSAILDAPDRASN
jgi:heptosyltransferase-3